MQTTPPGRHLVLYDGHCHFCVKQLERLVRWVGDRITPVDFQEPGALDALPGITHDLCMEAMIHVAPDGKVHRGFEAAARAFATRRSIGWVAFGYYVPGVRQACDAIYARIAANRYRLAAKDCPTGACAQHARATARATRPSPGARR